MKNIKKVLALALFVITVMAVTLPATAATIVNVGWVDATTVGDLGGTASCIYSRKSESGAYVVVNLQDPTDIQVKFDQSSMYWASARYGSYTGYIPFHHFDITDSNMRIGMFSNSSLQRGFEGQAVKNLQICLDSKGYDTNGIDGIFGGGTESAVEAFQDAYSLYVDGIAGVNTKLKLLEVCNLID